LQHEVVLIGVRRSPELWDAQRWSSNLTQNAPRFELSPKGRSGPKLQGIADTDEGVS